MSFKNFDIITIGTDKESYVYGIDTNAIVEIKINVDVNEIDVDSVLVKYGFQFYGKGEDHEKDEKNNQAIYLDNFNNSVFFQTIIPISIPNINFIDMNSGYNVGGYNYIEIEFVSNVFKKPISKKFNLNVLFDKNNFGYNGLVQTYSQNSDYKLGNISEGMNKWYKIVQNNDNYVWIWRFKYPVIVDTYSSDDKIKKFFGDFISKKNYISLKSEFISYALFEEYLKSPIRKFISKCSGWIIVISLLLLIAFYIYVQHMVISSTVAYILALIPFTAIIIAVLSYYLAPKVSKIVFNKISKKFYNIQIGNKQKIYDMINNGNYDANILFKNLEIYEDIENEIYFVVYLNVFLKTFYKSTGLFSQKKFIDNKIMTIKIFEGQTKKTFKISDLSCIVNKEIVSNYLIDDFQIVDSKIYYEIEYRCFCLTIPDYEGEIVFD